MTQKKASDESTDGALNPEVPADLPLTEDPTEAAPEASVEDEREYWVGTWNDRPTYNCRYCPWDTLGEADGGGGVSAVLRHIEDTHRPAFVFEQPKPMLYDQHGQPLR